MERNNFIIAALLCGMGSSAWASGFAVSGKSASSLGNANSGTAVHAEDAGVVYSNPAAMLDLDGSRFSVVFNTIHSDLSFKDKGSSTSGPSSATVDDPHFVPNFYYVRALDEDLRFGFGIYSPYGLGLDYDDDWKGRYITTESSVRTVNFNPAIAFRASDKLNLGFGVELQYLDASLSNAMDFGTICYAYESYGYLPGGYCAGEGMVPQGSDGSQTLSGDNWALGYSFGLTYDHSEATRLGMSFHSATRHDITGTSDFKGAPDALQAMDMFTDTGANLGIMLPETLSLGISHQATPRLQLLADATWTGWGRYEELVVDFNNNTPTSRTRENWHSTWRLAVGGHYRLNDDWLLRAGYAHDPTPIPDPQHRTPRVPDSDRDWLALGANAKLKKGLDMDLALFYNLPNKVKIDNTDSLGHNLKGEFEAEILYLTAQLNWAF